MKRIISRLWPFIKPRAGLILLCYLSMVISNVMILIGGMWIFNNSETVAENPIIDFVPMIVSFIGVYLVLSYFQSYSMIWVSLKMMQELQSQVFTVICTNVSIVDQESSRELQNRIINDAGTVGAFFSTFIPQFFFASFRLVFGFIGLRYVGTPEPLHGAVIEILPIVIIVVLFPSIIGPYVRRYGAVAQQSLAESGRYAGEAFSNWQVVHAFNQFDNEKRKFSKAIQDSIKATLDARRLDFIAHGISNGVTYFFLVWVALRGYQLFTDSIAEVDFGQILAMSFFLLHMALAIRPFSIMFTGSGEMLGRVDKITSYLDCQVLPDNNQKEQFQDPITLELRNLSYKYPTRDTYALQNVNLKFQPNTKTVIVGMSGAGKSTLFKMLLRLIKPTSGELLGNDKLSEDYPLVEWRKHFGYVPQGDYLFSSSVSENIAYGRSSASSNDIRSVSQAAFADEFILNLPNGYETDIGEVGSELSGGQRQRINLARAIMIKPSIYLLDEATNALDAETERIVQQTITQLSKLATFIIIAHRIDTIVSADQIVLMSEGRVVDVGTHKYLASRYDSYRILLGSFRP